MGLLVRFKGVLARSKGPVEPFECGPHFSGLKIDRGGLVLMRPPPPPLQLRDFKLDAGRCALLYVHLGSGNLPFLIFTLSASHTSPPRKSLRSSEQPLHFHEAVWFRKSGRK